MKLTNVNGAWVKVLKYLILNVIKYPVFDLLPL